MLSMTCLRFSLSLGSALVLGACTTATIIEASSDYTTGQMETTTSETSGDETGSASAGDGDGDPIGDGDGDPASGDGDGDGDPTTGDGDGDGDGDMSGDGDGDPGPICGDGVAAEPEECDGDDFGGRDCETFGLLNGSLLCTDECVIDTSNCEEDPCGNGMIDDGEQCDGDDFAGLACIDFGEAPGELTCNDCQIDVGECGLDGEGDLCAVDDNCSEGLYCYALNCYDGSVGDPCQMNNECVTGNCAGGLFKNCEL